MYENKICYKIKKMTTPCTELQFPYLRLNEDYVTVTVYSTYFIFITFTTAPKINTDNNRMQLKIMTNNFRD